MASSSTPLRIALLAVHSNPLDRLGTRQNGGMSIYLTQTARELGRLGHQVDIFTCNPAPGKPVVDEPFDQVRIISLVPPPDMFPGSPSEYAGACAARIRDYCHENAGGYQLLHSHYWLSGSVGQVLCSSWNIPHLVTFHTRARAKCAACAGHREPRLRLDTEDELVGHCDRLIASTASEAEELAEQVPDGSARIRVVGCGVDLERFRPAAQPGKGSGRNRREKSQLLFVGRFDPMKNIPLLLDSLARLEATVHVRFLGGGGMDTVECETLLSQARERGVGDRAEVYGSVPHEQIPAFYQEADAVVVSSSYESFGLVVLEALACGTVVISTPVGIAPQVIQDGFNGYLADPGDPARFAEAIHRTLELSRTSDPAAVHATVEEFGWSRVARSLLDVYNEL